MAVGGTALVLKQLNRSDNGAPRLSLRRSRRRRRRRFDRDGPAVEVGEVSEVDEAVGLVDHAAQLAAEEGGSATGP